MRPLIWPSERMIAWALCEAAKAEGEDALEIVAGKKSRARTYALVVLCHWFDAVDPRKMARALGASEPRGFIKNARAIVVGRKGCQWFDIDRLNAINAALGWPAMTVEQAAEALSFMRSLSALDRVVAAQAAMPQFEPTVGTVAQTEPEAAPELPAPKPISSAAKALAVAARHMRPEPVASSQRAPQAQREAIPIVPTGAVDIHYRPDAPAEARGVTIVTSNLMGDPPPGRSALAQRLAEPACK